MKTLYIISAFVFVIFVIWHLLTKKYVDYTQCVLILGARGSGKSTTKTKMISKSLASGRPTYTDDTDVFLDGLRIFDVYDLGKKYAPNSDFYIDELNRYFDNRNFQDREYLKKANDFLIWLRYIRKQNCNVYLFTQSHDIDKKIRTNLSDVIILHKYLRVFTVGRKLRKSIYLKDTATEADTQIAQKLQFEPFFKKQSWIITFIPKWVNKFDSYSDNSHSHEPLKYRKIENGKISDNYYYNTDDIKNYEQYLASHNNKKGVMLPLKKQ